MSLTRDLAQFVCGIEYERLPQEVAPKLRKLMLDCLGNQIGAHAEEGARMLHRVLGAADVQGPSTVVGFATRTTPLLAGCMNGMLAHLLDMDDAHRDSLTKTGSAVTPAVFALAEARGSAGQQAIEAAAAGYEVMIRLGLGVNPAHRMRGFHSTATLGAFGAAAAAGRLLGLAPERMTEALGIAATQSAGLTAFIDNASMTKPLNVARAVYSGILAAQLAAEGFRGPPDGLEGREGFVNAYAGRFDAEAALAGLGSRYRLLESGFKPHAACRYAHGPIDAAARLRAAHGFGVDDIEAIDVRISELAHRQSAFYEPGTVASAQGSTPFVIAACLALGRSALTAADVKTAFHDERTWRLHRHVKVHIDPAMDRMGRGCSIVIALRDGRRLEDAVPLPRGEPENPMSDAEIAAKFMRQAEPVLGSRQATEIAERMAELDRLPNVAGIMSLTDMERSIA
jgi:2-methylcitrate dehydratase PrpD